MISWLSGQVLDMRGRVLTLDVGGVGYEVYCTSRCAARMTTGARVSVVIYTAVREDEIKLYGFDDGSEREVFLLLLRVSGIGAKTAAEVLSHISATDLLRAIGTGDVDALRSIRGVGKKTAERMIVELKDKVGEYVEERVELAPPSREANGGAAEEALLALQALGFEKREATRALERALQELTHTAESGELVRTALRFV